MHMYGPQPVGILAHPDGTILRYRYFGVNDHAVVFCVVLHVARPSKTHPRGQPPWTPAFPEAAVTSGGVITPTTKRQKPSRHLRESRLR